MLAKVSLGADAVARLVAATREPEPDRLALARLERERDAALARYRKDRDQVALTTAMARIDAAEDTARNAPATPALTAAEVREYLTKLPTLWDDAPNQRRAMSEALAQQIEVIGIRTIRVTPTAEAIERGLVEAFRTGTVGNGRGERRGGPDSRLILALIPGVETRLSVVLPRRAPLRIVEASA